MIVSLLRRDIYISPNGNGLPDSTHRCATATLAGWRTGRCGCRPSGHRLADDGTRWRRAPGNARPSTMSAHTRPCAHPRSATTR